MKQEEILQYNKLCAEFLELEKHESNTYWLTFPFLDRYDWYYTCNLKFHSDWNWIMEVLQKIENLNYSVELSNLGALNYVCYIRSRACWG